MTNIRTRNIAAFVLTVGPAIALAQGGGAATSGEQVAEQVREAILTRLATSTRSDVDVSVRAPKAQLPACDALGIELPEGDLAGRVHARIRCERPKPWSMYMGAQVTVMATIPVANRPVARGTRITSAMLGEQQMPKHLLRGHTLINPQDIVGKVAKRSLRPDTPISVHALSQPQTIKKGDRVAIEATSGRIQIQSFGTALSGGHVGDQIEVVNEGSQRTIRPWVAGPGRVSTDPPLG